MILWFSMTEPLGEKPKLLSKELFTKAAVDRFKSGKGDIERGNLRHYNQLVTQFDDAEIRVALSKLHIPIQARVTIYGGFTGQFAHCLRRIGMRVIFTDPMTEWVEQAKEMGFEAYEFAVQEMPKEIVERTDLFASFECYPDLIGLNEYHYPMMRFLTVQYGVLFAESKNTVWSMREEENDRTAQELGAFRRWFRPIYLVYRIRRKATKTQHLNFYHLYADLEIRKILTLDCRIMKAIYDIFETEHRVTTADILTIANKANIDKSLVESSIKRLRKLSDAIHAPFVKSFPTLAPKFKGSLHIGSKRLFFDYE